MEEVKSSLEKAKIHLYNAIIIIKEYAEFEDDDKFWEYITKELGLDEETLKDMKEYYKESGWKI